MWILIVSHVCEHTLESANDTPLRRPPQKITVSLAPQKPKTTWLALHTKFRFRVRVWGAQGWWVGGWVGGGDTWFSVL